jgi:hypothetical protein
MKVRLKMQMSGPRPDGSMWPEVGSEMTVSAEEAEQLEAAGIAEPTAKKTAKPESSASEAEDEENPAEDTPEDGAEEPPAEDAAPEPPPKAAPTPAIADDAQIREWAQAQGLAIAARGRIPADIRALYDGAHQG